MFYIYLKTMQINTYELPRDLVLRNSSIKSFKNEKRPTPLLPVRWISCSFLENIEIFKICQVFDKITLFVFLLVKKTVSDFCLFIMRIEIKRKIKFTTQVTEMENTKNVSEAEENTEQFWRLCLYCQLRPQRIFQ